LLSVETWTLGEVEHNYLESFQVWCWWWMEKNFWTDRVRSEEVLQRVRVDRNTLHTVKRRKAKWIGHILPRNYLLQHIIEGKIERRIEMKVRRGRRHKQLLDDRKETRGCCILKEQALDRTLWRTRCGIGYGYVVRQAAELCCWRKWPNCCFPWDQYKTH
jgi:hypothetical protein